MSDHFHYAIGIAILLVIVGGMLLLAINKGSFERWWTNLNKDRATATDMIYQTGSVRVYKFVESDFICFLADKQGASTAIWCR